MKAVFGFAFTVFVQSLLFASVPPPVLLPSVLHRDVIGQDSLKAEAVFLVLNALLEHRHLPTIEIGQHYGISRLVCSYTFQVWEIGSPLKSQCALDFEIENGERHLRVDFEDVPPLRLAKELFDTLVHAGSTYKELRYGASLDLKNLNGKNNELHFDDYSNYVLPTTPNITAQGQAANDFIRIFDSLNIEAPDSSLLVICTALDSEFPQCNYHLRSEVFPEFDAELSLRLWRSIKAMAVASGFQTSWGGSLDEMTIINLRDLSFDGTTLRMHLTAGNGGRPPTSLPTN